MGEIKMRPCSKDDLADKIFSIITSEILDYEAELDVSMEWSAELKLNGKDYYEFKKGLKHY
jgi:hypothetical protein